MNLERKYPLADQQHCDNGGWNCWLCPSGCHTVPFDFPDGVTAEDAALEMY